MSIKPALGFGRLELAERLDHRLEVTALGFPVLCGPYGPHAGESFIQVFVKQRAKMRCEGIHGGTFFDQGRRRFLHMGLASVRRS